MVNEDIVSGIISALSRGESLERAMMTFYNAGYEKKEIESAAKVVYSQLGAQAMGVKGSLQETLNEIANKAGVSEEPQQIPQKSNSIPAGQIRASLQKREPEINKPLEQVKEKTSQYFSNYGRSNSNIPKADYSNADQIASKIESVIKGLKPVNIPSRIEIINRSIEPKQQKNVQRISDYRETPPKPVSKAITLILIFILIALLGILAAVFFFREDLIKLFNNMGLS